MNRINGCVNSVIQAQQDPHDSRVPCFDNPGDPTGKPKEDYVRYLAYRFFMKTVPECEQILSKDKFIVWYLVTMNGDWSTDIKVKFSDGEDVIFSILPTRM